MCASLVIAWRTLSSDAPADVRRLPMCAIRLVQVRRRHRDRELLEPVAADDDDVGVDRVEAVVNSSAVRHAVFASPRGLPPSITLKNDEEM